MCAACQQVAVREVMIDGRPVSVRVFSPCATVEQHLLMTAMHGRQDGRSFNRGNLDTYDRRRDGARHLRFRLEEVGIR